MTSFEARDRLIVALDLPSAKEAELCVAKLGSAVNFYKIGLELICSGEGFRLAERLIGNGARVFLDMKLHDIPNTVERATRRVSAIGASFLTVHAYPQTMRAAVEGAANSGLMLLGVSVLTSTDDSDLADAGYALNVQGVVSRRAAQAEEIGLQGLVSSARELSTLRGEGRRLTLVCPGIRPSGDVFGDQKRVATPARAIRDGADFLVVGRPITSASDPRASAEAIVREIMAAGSTEH
jgi:orotidine-5'-phosphate decarboxylase